MRRIGILSTIVLIASCGLVDSFDEIPAFIHVEEVEITTTNDQGSGSHNIKDVWLAVDGFSLGPSPIPAKIPVLTEGAASNNLIIFAGIRNNGIAEQAIQYPFLAPIVQDLSLSAGEETNLDLKFNYRAEVKFPLIESFDNSNIFTFDEDGDEETKLVAREQGALEGLKSGYAVLDADNPIIEFATAETFTELPLNGSPIYLEMDYKSNLSLNVGLIGILGNSQAFKNYKIVLKPQEDWNKIYIEFTPDILQSGLDGYKILIGSEYSTEEAGSAVGEIFLDNVKLVHF